jgi:hypothetical protein
LSSYPTRKIKLTASSCSICGESTAGSEVAFGVSTSITGVFKADFGSLALTDAVYGWPD